MTSLLCEHDLGMVVNGVEVHIGSEINETYFFLLYICYVNVHVAD